MSHPNHRRRPNRTFRVEALESRALLSTAGVICRPAAAIAPLERVSPVAGDPKLTGDVVGKLVSSGPNQVTFKTTGPVTGGHGFAGGKATFNGVMNARPGHGEIKYSNGSAKLTSGNGVYLYGIDDVIATEIKGHLMLDGKVLTAGLERATGKFVATGTIDAKGQVKIKIELDLKTGYYL
jgi:hypothetical protein